MKTMNLANNKMILYIIGVSLGGLAFFMYVPMTYAFFDKTTHFFDFAKAIILTHASSFICIRLSSGRTFNLGVKEMFLITTSVWLSVSIFASFPFIFVNHISFVNAFFETMSGITTTGSTVFTNLDNMDHSILLWRSMLQWIGGVGFIVIGVAILPFLNVGGMKLFHTESSDWSDKATDKARSIALKIVLLYLILSILCCISYIFSGMNFFDAINHSMTTLSTGGYSTRDSSMNNFNHSVHWFAILFMFLGSLPFLLLIKSMSKKSYLSIVKDTQVKGFFWLIILFSLISTIILYFYKSYDIFDAIRISLFNTISIVSTTGYGLDDYGSWSQLSILMFLFLLVVGGCSGSTAGGIKIFRFQIAAALTKNQINKALHPSIINMQQYNGHQVTENVVSSIVTFMSIFLLTILCLSVVLVLSGLDIISALSGAMTAVANVGPGIGPIIGPTGNFADLNDTAKLTLALGMLMGRLELLTVFVLFTKSFWSRF